MRYGARIGRGAEVLEQKGAKLTMKLAMQPAADLKQRINDERVTTGLLGTDHVWPLLVDLCQSAGLDYLIVDCEHGPHDDALVAQVCLAGRLAGFPVLIRVPSTSSDVTRRALDLGACGLMFPCIESTQDLDKIRESVYLPPRGRRRPGGYANYWISDFDYKNWKEEFEDHLIILTQIETERGVENAEAIAQHEIVTSLAIGPYDLSQSLGCCGDRNAPRVDEALRHIREAGKKAGKNTWMGMGGQELVEEGWTFICFGTPCWILRDTVQQIASDARRASAVPVASASH